MTPQSEILPIHSASTTTGASASSTVSVPMKYFASGLLALASVSITVGSLPSSPRQQSEWTTVSTVASGAARHPRFQLADETRTLSSRVAQLKESSGLTWSQFAALFGVSRRAAHFWVQGGRMSDAHAARLGAIHRVMQAFHGLQPLQVRSALLSPSESGISQYAELVAQVHANDAQTSSPIDLLSANPESPYIVSPVTGGESVELDQRDL
jgi:hypothetical protein